MFRSAVLLLICATPFFFAGLLAPASAQDERPKAADMDHAEGGHVHEGASLEAEAPRVQQSRLMFFVRSVGLGGVVLLMAGVFCFALSLFFVIRGGQYAGPGLILTVSMPLLLATYFVFRGSMASFEVMAMSETQIKPSELAEGIASVHASLLFGFWMTLPAFLVALTGLALRTLRGEPEPRGN